MKDFDNFWKGLHGFVKGLILTILGILLITPGILFVDKFSTKLSENVTAWINTATYFNNVYTPILTIIGSFYIYRTYMNQKKSNSVAEQAFVYNYIKERLSMFIIFCEKNLNNIPSGYAKSVDDDVLLVLYKKKYPEYVATTFHWSNQLIIKLNILNKSISKYNFIEEPHELFLEEFQKINVFLEICENGLKEMIIFRDAISKSNTDKLHELDTKAKVDSANLEFILKQIEELKAKMN